MGNLMVKTQVEEVKVFLDSSVKTLECYLNDITISSLLSEKEGDKAYYKGIISNLRRLLVYCEEGLDACVIVAQNTSFNKAAAEKTLYKIYHQCIDEFFAPKYDLWYEDSRAAYTGKNAISFREEVPRSIQLLIAQLEEKFQHIREELEYYETDYRTKMMQSKG
ncbi:YpuI family protein [Bacillus spongiae]|uniref:YpuI family protein n=1 Tax=Bacillus spongiae TaxID=2683610 RepID=A0ABU8HDK2_9BACI